MGNKYIMVDWHGADDLNGDFTSIEPSEIDIYFYYSREIGQKTCRANCAHCFFRIPGAENEAISIDVATAILHDLQQEGYNVGLTPADSFADEVLNTGGAGSAYRISGIGATAWTSGAHLAGGDWREKLRRGREIGFTALVMNGHTVAGTAVPIRGVTPGSVLQRAIDNVNTWNKDHPHETFDLGLTFTLRRDTVNIEAMRQMAQFALEHGVKWLRFNCFANYLGQEQMQEFELRREDVEAMYHNLATLHVEFVDTPVLFSVSEDFGDAGVESIFPYIEEKYRDHRTGLCLAGRRLFAITPINNILTVVGCVDRMAPYLGRVEQVDGRWSIRWFYDRIELLRQARVKKDLYGCFGGVGRNRPETEGFNSTDGNNLLSKLTRQPEDVVGLVTLN